MIQDRRGTGNKSRILGALLAFLSIYFLAKSAILTGCILLVASIHLLYMGHVLSQPPINNPARFILRFRIMSPARPVMVCIGDSLIHGRTSDDWIPKVPFLVSEKMKFDCPQVSDFMDPVWIVNAAQNGITSWIAHTEKIQQAVSCYPDYILLMIGTNDVLSMYSPLASVNAAVTWSLPETCKMSVLERNLISMLDSLAERSPSTEVAVCTIPPLGEDLASPANRLVKEANEIIRNIVESREAARVTVLDVNERLQSEITKGSTGKKLPIELAALLMAFMAPLHYYLGIPWQMLSGIVGNRVLFDGMHLNEVGGDIVAGVVTDWLFTKNIHKAIAVKQFS